MKFFLIGLFLLGSLSSFADSQSLESCSYDATTRALEERNTALTKAQLELKILNVVERECLMSEYTTLRDQENNPLLINGIKRAIIDYKKSHKKQVDLHQMISSLL